MTRAFNIKDKVFFIIFKGLFLKQIKRTFLGDENQGLRFSLKINTFIK